MRRRLRLFLIFLLCVAAFPVTAQPSGEFRERLAQIAVGSEVLWGIRFEANIALLYPSAGKMVLCRRTEMGLACDSTLLDQAIPVSNSTTEYRGVRYLTIVADWIARDTPVAKTELTAHESFHIYQEILGIPIVSSSNAHLDTPEGRVLLQMEFEALRKAIYGDRKALQKAMLIRETRLRMFPANNEARFELHEGLAQYTGIRISRTADKDVLQCVDDALRYDIERGYTNSFAYATGPAYALLLDRYMPNWRLRIREAAGLPELLAQVVPATQKNTSITNKREYARLLRIERREWEDPSQYELWLNGNADVLRIPNDGINIVFNPSDRIIPIGDQAVLLRNVTLKGDWGTLTVRHGIVRRNDWSEFILAAPENTSENVVRGSSYRFDLASGWEIIHSGGSWKLRRSE